MPTYNEALFEPLEAWIAELRVGLAITESDADRLRLIFAKAIIEHAGRGDRPVVKS